MIKNYVAHYLTAKRNENRRSRLRNTDFTIISQNCIGGVIYHNLGKQFSSPTINLWFKPNDFLRLLENLPYYLTEATLVADLAETARLGYPVGILDNDIKVYFQHYRDFQEAKTKWDERKHRVNYDNLFIIMTDRDGCTLDMMQKFGKLSYKNKVILVGKSHPECSVALKLNRCLENNHLGNVFKGNLVTGKTKLDQFDYVTFLNDGKVQLNGK